MKFCFKTNRVNLTVIKEGHSLDDTNDHFSFKHTHKAQMEDKKKLLVKHMRKHLIPNILCLNCIVPFLFFISLTKFYLILPPPHPLWLVSVLCGECLLAHTVSVSSQCHCQHIKAVVIISFNFSNMPAEIPLSFFQQL